MGESKHAEPEPASTSREFCAEMEKRTAARQRAERAARKGQVIFQRIADGLYVNHPLGFTLSRDLVWNRGEAPRWTATWKGFQTCGILRSPATQTQRCDTMAEAREWCGRFAKTLVTK